jgi:crossover junction endodeoxyribonuclease RuvC
MTGRKSVICGIDGGLSGAISFLDLDTRLATVSDIPTQWRPSYDGKRKRHYLVADLVRLLKRHRKDILFCVIELAQPHHHDGKVSSFSNGRGLGLLEGIVSSLGLKYELVKPQYWKTTMGLNQDKELSRQRALSEFPELAESLKRKKHHNRAESLLLGLYGKQLLAHKKIS